MEAEVKKKNSHFSSAQTKSRKRTYTDAQLAQALKSLREEREIGKGSISEVARKYRVPRQTLVNKFYGISPLICSKPGPEAALGKDAEKNVENWILEGYRRRFSIPKEVIFYSVKSIIDQIPEQDRQKLPFHNNTPGKGWFTSFKKRHPKIQEKYNESLKSNQLCISDNLNTWFSDVEEILGEEDAKDAVFDPARIFIMDEIFLKFSSEKKLILSDKKKYVGKCVTNDNDNEFSFLFAASAEGKIVPPFTICKSSASSKSLVNILKSYWKQSSTDFGTLTCELFHDYIVNTFYPYLVERQSSFPIVVFLGCDFPYLSLPLYNFCERNGLCMICLPRNSKEIQSIDWTLHHFLDDVWKRCNGDLNQDRISLNYFLSSFNNDISEGTFEQLIKERFQCNKLYPFNPEKKRNRDISRFKNVKNYPRNTAVDYMECHIPRDILIQFRHNRNEGVPWDGIIDYKALYGVWLAVVNDAQAESLCTEEKLTNFEESDTEIEWMIAEEVEV